MSYYDQYGNVAAAAASQYGIPVPIFDGLVQTESSWNPNAQATGSSAYGFTQLLSGTAQQLGINRGDPTQQLYGGAEYLASMPGSNWTEKLAHYYQGPGASIGATGMEYASKVMGAAKKFMDSSLGKDLTDVALLSNPVTAPLGIAQLGSGGGADWVSEIKDWIASTGFFQRIALALVALLLVLGAIYTLKGKSA